MINFLNMIPFFSQPKAGALEQGEQLCWELDFSPD